MMVSRVVLCFSLLCATIKAENLPVATVLELEGQFASILSSEDMVKTCNTALESLRDPESRARVLEKRGIAQYKLDNYDLAERDLAESQSVIPTSFEGGYYLARIRGRTPSKQVWAEKWAQDALAAFPNKGEPHLVQGVIALSRESYREARDMFSLAIGRDLTLGDAYSLRAFANCEMRDWNAAIRDGKTSLTLCGSVAKPALDYVTIGRGMLGLRDFHEAERYLGRGYVLSPNSLAIHQALWIAYSGQGKFAHSLLVAERALKIDDRDAMVRSMLSRSLGQTRSIERALAEAEEAVRLGPRQFYAWSSLASLKCRSGAYEEAITAFRKALELKGSDPDSQLRYAFLLSTCPDEGFLDGETAVKLARICVELFKTPRHRVAALAVLACAHAERGEFDVARRMLSEAAKLAQTEGYGEIGLHAVGEAFAANRSYRVILGQNANGFDLEIGRLYQE